MAGLSCAAEPGAGGEDLAGNVRVLVEAEVDCVGVDGGGDTRRGRRAEGEGKGIGVGESGGERAHETVEREGEVWAGTGEVGAEEPVPWDGIADRWVVAGRRVGGEA